MISEIKIAGHDAWQAGAQAHENPYDEGDWRREAWAEGWAYADTTEDD